MSSTIIITEEQVAAFVGRCQEIIDAHVKANFSEMTPDLLVFDYPSAKKYCRIVSRHRYKQEDGTIKVNDGGSA
jgi:hypothetical protein